MAGNLGKEDSSSVQGVQDASIIGGSKMADSDHKRARAGNKSSAATSRNQRERKKEEAKKLKADMKELKESKIHLDGQAFQLRQDLKETREEMKGNREENTKLKIVGKSQSDSILEMEKKLIALGEHHQQEIQALQAKHAQEMLERDRELNALKEEHELHMRVCAAPWAIDAEYLLENAGEMNNPMETVPATAQATSNFVNSDPLIASQMA